MYSSPSPRHFNHRFGAVEAGMYVEALSVSTLEHNDNFVYLSTNHYFLLAWAIAQLDIMAWQSIIGVQVAYSDGNTRYCIKLNDHMEIGMFKYIFRSRVSQLLITAPKVYTTEQITRFINGVVLE